MVDGGADGGVDDLARVFTEVSGGPSGSGGFGVGVGVERQYPFPYRVLDEVQRSSGGGVVGVGDPAGPVGPVLQLTLADDPARIRSTNTDVVARP